MFRARLHTGVVLTVMPRAHFVALVGGGPQTLRFGWRLLGSNNRELGRSSTSAESIDEALISVQELRTTISTATFSYVRSAHNQGWDWEACLSGQLVAHASRTFRRELECRNNAEIFVRALSVCQVRRPSDPTRLPTASLGKFISASSQRSDAAAPEAEYQQ